MSSPKPPADDAPTLVGAERDETSQPGAIPDDAAGGTAVVRFDRARNGAAPAPIDRTPAAPRKGLQIQLPEDEPDAAPPTRIAAPVAESQGRRGRWWDAKPKPTEPAPEPIPEPAPLPDPEPILEPEPEASPEPEVEPYRPVPADDYRGDDAPPPPAQPRWKRRLRRALGATGALTVLGIAAVLAGYFYISREIPTFDSVRDYRPFTATKVVAADGTVLGIES